MKRLIRWLTLKLLYRGKWKNLWDAESELSYWEVKRPVKGININVGKVEFEDYRELMFVPNPNYSEDDVKIKLTEEQFEDLVKFIILIR